MNYLLECSLPPRTGGRHWSPHFTQEDTEGSADSGPHLPFSLRDPSQSSVITHSPLQFQVPHVEDVLHRLKGVPEASFSSMVQEVSACPSLPDFPHLPGNAEARCLNFPLLDGYPVESKI